MIRPILLKVLPKDGTILEAGCGLGQWIVYLARQGYRMAGVELVEECVKICKNVYPDMDIRSGDVRALPYPDGSFAGMISLGVVEHLIEGPEQAVREMARTLRPGGIAVVTVPAFNFFMRAWYPVRRVLVDIFRWNPWVRKAMGRPPAAGDAGQAAEALRDLRSRTRPEFWPALGMEDGKAAFIEYKCRKGQIDGVMESAGFEVVESSPLRHPFSYRDIFGGIFLERGGGAEGTPELNLAGRVLDGLFRAFGPHFFNYMYLVVARKKERSP
ncbi:MAG: hypothetical protein A2636_06770 [Elusimicrobia bacterium RIFCSPHIGHO2_01_FULL_64_10]|nr:MAG: hypothetical protein A2636_06770 [Elusimicrobia bacterium RIFCSPHIGHO2_01_FULL_64_10]